MSGDVTLGIEEEVFVCEPEGPSTASLYYLARLLWSDPRRNFARTASNFARGADVRDGLMSCVEVSTGVHDDPGELLAEVAARRGELAAAVGGDGLIVPVGHLFDRETPSNVAALQFHVGAPDRERVYDNLAHFLPLLVLLTANSPVAGGRRFGQSYRMARGFATGPLLADPTVRFQDLIVSKRLGTIEVRVLDPVWDLERVRVLARAIHAIASAPGHLPADRAAYNWHRGVIATDGYVEEFLDPLYERLKTIADVPEHLLTRTAADESFDLFERHGKIGLYSALDSAWRGGPLEPRPISRSMGPSLMRSAAGFAGYYVPKFPYVTWKYLREK